MLNAKRARIWQVAVAAGLGVFALAMPAISADPGGQPGATDRPAAAASDAQSRAMALPAGFEAKDVRADNDVKSGLVKLAERAVTKGDFNKFLAELSTQDKERAREFKGADQGKLDVIIADIQKDWKAKYGQEFNINDKAFDQGVAILFGEVTDPASAMNNWPLPAESGAAAHPGNGVAPANDKDLKKEEKDAKLTKGRKVAIVRFLGSKDMPELTVSMIHELPTFYRVDIPNDRTGEQIYNDLVAHLSHLRDNSAQWPSNEIDAYRGVARCAAAAVYGVPVSEKK